MAYSEQITLKEKTLSESLAEFDPPALLPTVRSLTFSFRNKAKFVITGTSENPIIGLWGKENLDQGRELLSCPLHVEKINSALPHIKRFITESKLVPYSIETKRGELKGIIIFHSNETEEMYLRFILRSKESVTRCIKYHSKLLENIPVLKIISVNIQPIPHALLEGEEEIFITNKHSIRHGLKQVSMNLGPQAFVQTNQRVATELYETAASWIKDLSIKKFVELYCGQGAFSFFVAPYVEEALGVEINPAAILEAVKTAQSLNLSHLNFKSADAGKMQEDLTLFGPDIILVNPPRAGLKDAVSLLLKEAPQYLIYSSCAYETLSSDLRQLAVKYELMKVQIFDMFPHTKHFETLVLLKLKAT